MDKASWGWGPTQRISEEIPWTKQVGVEAQQREFPKKFHGQSKLLGPQQREFRRNSTDKASWGWGEDRDNEFYPSLAFILIREFYKVDKRDNYRQC